MLRIVLLSSLVGPTLVCLMFASEPATAAELYRWIEPDGTITFSPTPPPAGIAYEIVGGDSATAATPKEPSLGAAAKPRQPAATPTPATLDDDASALGTLQWHEPTVSTDTERQAPRHTGESVRSLRQDQSDASLVRASGKDQHCRDLAKRVVSLERRLATRLEPKQMDDTVVNMARYQRNIDQFCSR